MVNYSTYKVLRSFSIYSSLRINHTAAEEEEKKSAKTHFGYQTVDETEKQQKGSKSSFYVNNCPFYETGVEARFSASNLYTLAPSYN